LLRSETTMSVTPDVAYTKSSSTPSTASSALEFEPPLACVRRILKNALPSSTNVGKDASAAFARACGIFVIYITACANDFARESRRQTITANDVLASVKELDFDEFSPHLEAFLDRHRAAEKSKRDAKAKAARAAAEALDDEESDVPDPKRQKVELKGTQGETPVVADKANEGGDEKPEEVAIAQQGENEKAPEAEVEVVVEGD